MCVCVFDDGVGGAAEVRESCELFHSIIFFLLFFASEIRAMHEDRMETPVGDVNGPMEAVPTATSLAESSTSPRMSEGGVNNVLLTSNSHQAGTDARLAALVVAHVHHTETGNLSYLLMNYFFSALFRFVCVLESHSQGE